LVSFPSIWVSLSLTVLLWNISKPWPGERETSSIQQLGGLACYFLGISRISRCTHIS
jgi:hypothetical protein